MKKTSLDEERRKETYMLLQPSRPVLVTTLDEDGTIHVAPFSWVTPISVNPPLVGLALVTKPQKQHSLENIERHREFVINVPGLELAERLVQCSYDFKPGVKRLSYAGLKTSPAQKVRPLLIEECRAHLECRVLSITPTGDHSFIVSEVVAASFDPSCYTSNLILKVHENPPCFHIGHYRNPDGQTHFFLAPSDVRVIEVPFPKL